MSIRKTFPIKKRALEGILTPEVPAIKSRTPLQHDSKNIEKAVANQSREYRSLSFSLLINSRVTAAMAIEIIMARMRIPMGIARLLLWTMPTSRGRFRFYFATILS